jgi:hypothetical protein
MNEKRIQQVIEIEKRAQELLESAGKQAELVPAQAEKAAQVAIEESRRRAQVEAQGIIAQAQGVGETSAIVAASDQKVSQMEELAKKNFDLAVALVVDRVIGKA